MEHKNVAIYVRVSTAGQEQDGYSIGEQIDKLTKYCELQEWNIHDVYKDGGYSGSNLKRPAIQELIKDIKSNKVDTVLVYKLDRLSRSLVDTMELIEKTFNTHNVSFISMSESFDTNTPVGKVMVSILATFAQFERENITSRMKMGKIGRAKSGKVMSWSNPPFGYNYDHDTSVLSINDLQATVVKRIFNDYLDGVSITKLTDHLNEEGHIGKDIHWSYRTVRQILDNVVYTGKFNFNKKIYEGNHDAIITDDIYNKTQSELKRRQLKAYQMNNNPRPFRAKYMLTGIIFCGYCGARFAVVISHRHKTHEKLLKYKCYSKLPKSKSKTNKRYGSCAGPAFYRMPEIERTVINRIKNLDFKDVKSNNEREDVSIYESQIKKANNQIKRLLDMTSDDNMPIDIIHSKIKDIQDQQHDLQLQIDRINENKTEFTKSDAKALLESIPQGIEHADYEKQRTVVHQLIKRIELTENNVKIFWRF
ncbi:recombinase family protein [Paucilactobacillus sp. N302-9]